MCMFCGEFGSLVPGDDDAFDLDEFLDMCSAEATSGWSEPKPKDANLDVKEDDDAEADERAFRREILGRDADERVQDGSSTSRVSVMEWASTQLEAAGYGRGRVVTVSSSPGETRIRMVDAQRPLEVRVAKDIADVVEGDIKDAIAAAGKIAQLGDALNDSSTSKKSAATVFRQYYEQVSKNLGSGPI